MAAQEGKAYGYNREFRIFLQESTRCFRLLRNGWAQLQQYVLGCMVKIYLSDKANKMNIFCDFDTVG